MQHNDIRDLTAELMSETCHDVSKEPSLQPLRGESLSLRTCNWDDGARLDIKASGFWVVGFNPLFLISEYLTFMLLRTDLTLTASMNVPSAEHVKSEFVRLNKQASVLSCSPPQVEDPILQSDELVMLLSWLLPIALYHHVHKGFSGSHSSVH